MADQYLHFVLKDLDEIAFHVFPGRFQDQIARLGETAEQDDRFRAAEHDEIGQRQTQHRSREVEDIFGQPVSLDGRVIDLPGIQFVFRNFAQEAGFFAVLEHFNGRELDPGGGGVAFKRSLFAGTLMIAAIRDDDGMSEFAGKTVVTVDEASVRDDAASDARPKRDHDKILHPLGGAVHLLADGGSIGVVGKYRRKLEFIPDQLGQRNNAAPGKVGSIFDRAAVIIAVGCAHADASHPADTAGFFDQEGQMAVQFFDKSFYVAMTSGRDLAGKEDIAVAIDDAEFRAGTPDVDADSQWVK